MKKYISVILALALCLSMAVEASIPASTAKAVDEGYVSGTVIESFE